MGAVTGDRHGGELVEVGVFERPHGVRGEIAFDGGEPPRPPFPYRELILPARGSAPARTLVVTAARTKMDRWLLTLEGISSPEAARELTGRSACVPESSLPSLPDDAIYLRDLVGMELLDAASGTVVGTVREVYRLAGRDYLELDHEKLVPLAQELVTSIDRAGRRIVMTLPAGLLDDGGDDVP